MARSISLNQVRTDKLGIVYAGFDKISSDGDVIGTHLISVMAGGSIDKLIGSVNAQYSAEGFSPIPDADVARVKATAAATWTPENIAPVTAQVVEAIAVQQAAIAEAAAKKAALEAAAAKEIEDAKVRETAANEAKAAAEAAEQAAKAAEASAKAAADAAEKENARLAQALAVAEAAAKAAADKQAFDDAVAAAVREAA